MIPDYPLQANKPSNQATTFSASVPSKTFLLGEYAVLDGGPGMLVNTEPRFYLHAKTADPVHRNGIPSNSPTAQFIADHATAFRNFQITFHDPHQLRGGLGASSAQFVLCYYFAEYITHRYFPNQNTDNQDYNQLVTTYRHYAWDKTGLAPSGYDLIAQLNGQITYHHHNLNNTHRYHWPFTDAGFYLIHTGHKLATHEHLKSLNAIPSATLGQIVNQANQALQQVELSPFVTCINDYAQALATNRLVAEHTLRLLTELRQQPGVLAAKGCGALGADIILVIMEKPYKPRLQHWAKQRKLSIIADETKISQGLLSSYSAKVEYPQTQHCGSSALACAEDEGSEKKDDPMKTENRRQTHDNRPIK